MLWPSYRPTFPMHPPRLPVQGYTSDTRQMTKPEPCFFIAAKVKKASRADLSVLVPIAEYLALKKAAGK